MTSDWSWKSDSFSEGIHNYAPRHLDDAVHFLEKTIGKYPYEDVMGPTYDLSDLQSAMKVAIGKKYSRVLIKPNMIKELLPAI